MPVIINEPLTALQKGAEMVCFCEDFFRKAINEKESTKRMVYIAGYNAATYFLMKGRTGKPFNPMLGETYELVTNKYRFVAE